MSTRSTNIRFQTAAIGPSSLPRERRLEFVAGLLLRLWILPVLAAAPLAAREIVVHAATGADSAGGTRNAPVATLRRAVALARPGDTIRLGPRGAVFREMLTLANVRDLTIEGNDCIVTGADPLPADPARWEQISNGLHRIRLPKTLQDRQILVVGGRSETMGRTKYQIMAAATAQRQGGFDEFRRRLTAQYPKPGDLKPGQFAWEPIDERTGWLYVRGALDRLEWSVRPQGVYTDQEVHNVTIRRLHARHALNDGFNIHGNAQDIRLFNVTAHECFDNGISPHGACSFSVQDSEFLRNELAVGNDFLTDTHFLRCTIGGSVQEEIMIIGGQHRFEDCHVRATGPVAIRLQHSPPGPNRPLALKEIAKSGKDPSRPPHYAFAGCTIESADDKPRAFVTQRGVNVTIERCTFRGIEFQTDPDARVSVVDSTLDGAPLTEAMIRRQRPIETRK